VTHLVAVPGIDRASIRRHVLRHLLLTSGTQWPRPSQHDTSTLGHAIQAQLPSRAGSVGIGRANAKVKTFTEKHRVHDGRNQLVHSFELGTK
jgi:hypothetical protein